MESIGSVTKLPLPVNENKRTEGVLACDACFTPDGTIITTSDIVDTKIRIEGLKNRLERLRRQKSCFNDL